MILHCFLETCVLGTGSLYAFLPLALAGFATAIIFGVQWSVGLISDRNRLCLQNSSTSQGADQ